MTDAAFGTEREGPEEMPGAPVADAPAAGEAGAGPADVGCAGGGAAPGSGDATAARGAAAAAEEQPESKRPRMSADGDGSTPPNADAAARPSGQDAAEPPSASPAPTAAAAPAPVSSDPSHGWMYTDLSGQPQGPFAWAEICSWAGARALPPNLRIWHASWPLSAATGRQRTTRLDAAIGQPAGGDSWAVAPVVGAIVVAEPVPARDAAYAFNPSTLASVGPGNAAAARVPFAVPLATPMPLAMPRMAAAGGLSYGDLAAASMAGLPAAEAARMHAILHATYGVPQPGCSSSAGAGGIPAIVCPVCSDRVMARAGEDCPSCGEPLPASGAAKTYTDYVATGTRNMLTGRLVGAGPASGRDGTYDVYGSRYCDPATLEAALQEGAARKGVKLPPRQWKALAARRAEVKARVKKMKDAEWMRD